MITIKAKTSNPIEEHKIDILDRLDPEMKIGKVKKQLLKGYIINEMSGGCQCDDKSIRQPKLKGYVIN